MLTNRCGARCLVEVWYRVPQLDLNRMEPFRTSGFQPNPHRSRYKPSFDEIRSGKDHTESVHNPLVITPNNPIRILHISIYLIYVCTYCTISMYPNKGLIRPNPKPGGPCWRAWRIFTGITSCTEPSEDRFAGPVFWDFEERVLLDILGVCVDYSSSQAS